MKTDDDGVNKAKEIRMHTTLEDLHKSGAFVLRYKLLCKRLGGMRKYGKKTPLPYLRILEINGLKDSLWALADGDERAVWVCRLAALAFAQRAGRYTIDVRVQECNRVTHFYLHGEATEEELAAAGDAAYEAACAAAHDAAAHDAANEAAWAAAYDAARAAAWAAEAVAGAAWDAALAAGFAAERMEQISILKAILTQCEEEI